MRLLIDECIDERRPINESQVLPDHRRDDAGYSGYVPELPSILVTGKSIEELTACAKEAVRLYWETLQTD